MLTRACGSATATTARKADAVTALAVAAALQPLQLPDRARSLTTRFLPAARGVTLVVGGVKKRCKVVPAACTEVRTRCPPVAGVDAAIAAATRPLPVCALRCTGAVLLWPALQGGFPTSVLTFTHVVKSAPTRALVESAIACTTVDAR